MHKLLVHRFLATAIAFALLAASAYGAGALVQRAVPARAASARAHRHADESASGSSRAAAALRESDRSGVTPRGSDGAGAADRKPRHKRRRRQRRRHEQRRHRQHRRRARRRHPHKTTVRKGPAATTPGGITIGALPSPTTPAPSAFVPLAPTTPPAAEVGSHPKGKHAEIQHPEISEEREESESSPPPPPPPPAPTNTALPLIGGSATERQALTSTPGVWTGNPTSYVYRWEVCSSAGRECQAIGGATNASYTLVAGDVGHTIRVTVTAANAGGSTSATSAASTRVRAATSPPPPLPTNTTPPAISGADTEGDTLQATTGSWEGAPKSYAYSWQDCDASGEGCVAIAGATSSTYRLTASDVGDTVRVTVTATNAGGATPATSAPTAAIAEAASPPPPSAPVNTALPEISGASTEGEMLATTAGTWRNSPTSYADQWEICDAAGEGCSDIGGATSANYTLVAGDVGHTLRVTVTATNEGGSTPATSAATATITSPAKQPPPSPACSQTVSSTASAASAVQAATTETAICLKAGAYGALDLAGAHTKTVTVEPEPGTSASVQGVNIAASASGITIHNFSITGGVSLAAADSHIAVDHNDINGQGPGGIGEGVQTLSVNCSAPNAPTYSGCQSTAPDSYITINGNKIHGYGEGETEDAIHLNDWEHVTITANDIYNLEEHGNHTDAMQSVFGGHYMTFERNFEHDNQSQGFFIKDGDASEVTVNDNLFLRNDNEPELYPGGEYNIQVFNTTGLAITNNTVWDGQNDIIRAEGAAEALTANVNHNVEQGFDVLHEGGPAYTLTEDYDIFAEEPFTFAKGPHSKVEAHPAFVNAAGEDYELASNPNGIGMDWQPSEYVYGPTGD